MRAPVGAFTVIAGYGRSTTTGNALLTVTGAGVTTTTATNSDAKRDAFQLGAQYALSKRTLVEANYGYNKLRANTNDAATTAGGPVPGGRTDTLTRVNDRVSALNIGLKHSF